MSPLAVSRRASRAALLAYAAGWTNLLAGLLLVAFFGVWLVWSDSDNVWGPANDLVGSVPSALMIPVAFAIRRRLPAGRAAAVVHWLGVAAMVIGAVIGPLLVIGVLSIAVQMPIAVVAAVALFGWIALVSTMVRRLPGWSTPGRLGRAIGLVYLCAVVIVVVGLLLPWMSTAQLVVFGIGFGAGLLAWLAITAWLLVVGRALHHHPVDRESPS